MVEPDAPSGRLDRLLGSGVPHITGAVLASVQAWVLSVLVVLLPVLIATLTTAGEDATWGAARVGLRLWLFGHGVPQSVSGIGISLIPLGISALAVYAVYASTRRTGVATRAGLVAGMLVYMMLALLAGRMAGLDGFEMFRAALGGLVVGGIGTGMGLVRRSETVTWRTVAAPVSRRLASPVRSGLRASTLAVTMLLGASALLVGIWVLAGRATIGDVVRGLSLDAAGGVVFALAQLIYLPNLMIWALAWLAGPGFAVGDGTRFAPDQVVGGPMPAVPLLGALPTSSMSGSAALIAPAVIVGIGAVVGLYLHRRAPVERWWHQPAAVGTCALAVAVVTSALVVVSSGAAGPGRMAVVGAAWWQVGPLVGALVGGGAALVALPLSRLLRARAFERVRRR